MSLLDLTLSFVVRNKTAIVAALAVAGVAAGAYVYLLQPPQPPQGDAPRKKKRGGELPPPTPAAAYPFPVDANGAPALTEEVIASLDDATKELWALALKEAGNAVFKRKEFAAAVPFYLAALQLKQDPVYLLNRSACYAGLGDHEKVIEDTLAALVLEPEYVKCLLRRATSYEALERFPEAMMDLTAVTVYGGFNNQAVEKTLERVLKKHSVKVVERQMAERVPTLPSALAITSFFGAFTPETALEEELVDAAPASGDAYLAAGLKALDLNTPEGYEEADTAFAQAVAAYKAEESPVAAHYAVALEYSGAMRFLKLDPLHALEEIDALLALHARPRAYVFKALISADKANFEEAVANFEEAARADPASPDIYYHRGQMFYLIGELDQAAELFEKAKELNPKNVYAHIQLACIAYRNQDIEGAEAKFAQARTLFPTLPEVPNYYGEILADRGDVAGAIKQFDTALRLQKALPTFTVGAVPLVNVATLVLREGKVEEAIALLEQATALDPKLELARILLAQLMLQVDKVEEAVRLFEELLVLARSMEEKIQATLFAEAAKMQLKIKQDPHLLRKLAQLMAEAQAGVQGVQGVQPGV